MSTPLHAFLASVLGTLPQAALEALATSRAMDVAAGKPLLRAGDGWGSLYWVEQGALRLYYLDGKGSRRTRTSIWTVPCCGH